MDDSTITPTPVHYDARSDRLTLDGCPGCGAPLRVELTRHDGGKLTDSDPLGLASLLLAVTCSGCFRSVFAATDPYVYHGGTVGLIRKAVQP